MKYKTLCHSRHASSPQPLSDMDPLLENEKSSNTALKLNSEDIKTVREEKQQFGISISKTDIVVNEAIKWVYFCGLPDSRSEMFRFLAIESAVIWRGETNFRLTL